MAKRISQMDHNRMVADVVEDLISQGYAPDDVQAALPGYPKPPVIDGQIPDVFYYDGEELLIFEVETDDSIFDDHTTAQWTTFSDYVDEEGGTFIIVVPEGFGGDVEERLNELALDADILEL